MYIFYLPVFGFFHILTENISECYLLCHWPFLLQRLWYILHSNKRTVIIYSWGAFPFWTTKNVIPQNSFVKQMSTSNGFWCKMMPPPWYMTWYIGLSVTPKQCLNISFGLFINKSMKVSWIFCCQSVLKMPPQLFWWKINVPHKSPPPWY